MHPITSLHWIGMLGCFSIQFWLSYVFSIGFPPFEPSCDTPFIILDYSLLHPHPGDVISSLYFSFLCPCLSMSSHVVYLLGSGLRYYASPFSLFLVSLLFLYHFIPFIHYIWGYYFTVIILSSCFLDYFPWSYHSPYFSLFFHILSFEVIWQILSSSPL